MDLPKPQFNAEEAKKKFSQKRAVSSGYLSPHNSPQTRRNKEPVSPVRTLNLVEENVPIIPLQYAVCSIQGRRPTQEDAHSTLPNFGSKDEINGEEEVKFSFFGVYDGHAGERCADFVSQNIHTYLLKHYHSLKNYPEALRQSILQLDKEWLENSKQKGSYDGTTVVVAVIHENKILIGNVGDSEAIICIGNKATCLTEIHNPKKNAAEGQRVKDLGGVLWRDRLGHPVYNPAYFSIAVSRSIGDFSFKDPETCESKESGLIADPYIQEIDFDPNSVDFLLLGCDGLWDVMGYQEAADFVLSVLNKTDNPQSNLQEACDSVVQKALELGSQDNVTVLLVLFEKE